MTGTFVSLSLSNSCFVRVSHDSEHYLSVGITALRTFYRNTEDIKYCIWHATYQYIKFWGSFEYHEQSTSVKQILIFPLMVLYILSFVVTVIVLFSLTPLSASCPSTWVA